MMVRIYKIGGNVIDDPEALSEFLHEFSRIPGDKILVHGGGKESSRMCRRLGIEPKMIEGRRVTDRETLDVVTMIYAGLVNKRIVALLQSMGCNAVGLSGADGDSVRATRRSPQPVDFGYVGDITPRGVNAEFITSLLKEGIVPVFCAINHDGEGTLLNCNADSVAAAIAAGLARTMPVDLLFCFEQKGVLADVSNPDSVIAHITPLTYPALREAEIISGGMIPKVENALRSVDAGVRSVTIRSSQNLADGSGTCISV